MLWIKLIGCSDCCCYFRATSAKFPVFAVHLRPAYSPTRVCLLWSLLIFTLEETAGCLKWPSHMCAFVCVVYVKAFTEKSTSWLSKSPIDTGHCCRAAIKNYFLYWLMCRWLSINYLSIKCQKCEKCLSRLELNVRSSYCFFYPNNSPKHKDFSFIVINYKAASPHI